MVFLRPYQYCIGNGLTLQCFGQRHPGNVRRVSHSHRADLRREDKQIRFGNDFRCGERTLISEIASTQPDPSESINRRYATRFDRLRATRIPEEALFVVLTLEGLFFLKHFPLSVRNATETQKLSDTLLSLAKCR